MPWRRTHDPYRILVSEIMLQQTQVDRVRAKYAEFLKVFPTVDVLAAASLGDVLRVWSGLGYNRRAKYLHACAKEVVRVHGGKFPKNEVELKKLPGIVADYGGKFPRESDELRKLPGIGISTSAAVRAFAFDEDEPMIDTNIRRILVRIFFGTTIPSDKELYTFAITLIAPGEGRAWNYAMLDVGATLCTARNHSPECPFMKLHGEVRDFVYKKPQTKFLDSRRSYRGKVLRLLAKERIISVRVLHEYIGKKIPEMDEILLDLKKEGLIVLKNGTIALPP